MPRVPGAHIRPQTPPSHPSGLAHMPPSPSEVESTHLLSPAWGQRRCRPGPLCAAPGAHWLLPRTGPPKWKGGMCAARKAGSPRQTAFSLPPPAPSKSPACPALSSAAHAQVPAVPHPRGQSSSRTRICFRSTSAHCHPVADRTVHARRRTRLKQQNCPLPPGSSKPLPIPAGPAPQHSPRCLPT